MTKQEKIIVSAYTGVLMCDFHEMQCYIEQKLGHPVWTHELANKQTWEKIKEASKEDFIEICKKEEDQEKEEVTEMTCKEGAAISCAKLIEKKILPEYFDAVVQEEKTFEIRKDEDGAEVGDVLLLREWDGRFYTGRKVKRRITYILRGCPEYGLMDGYAIYGLQPIAAKWVPSDLDPDFITCSNCKAENLKFRMAYKPFYCKAFKFCPNCGRKIKQGRR